MYHLLIVDDEAIICQGLQAMVEDFGLPLSGISTAAGGQEALEADARSPADLILLDIMMPGMNGLDFLAELRRQGSAAKVIILSGSSDFTFAQRAIRYDVTSYLLKPVQRGELREALQTAMDQIAGERTLLVSHRQNEERLRAVAEELTGQLMRGTLYGTQEDPVRLDTIERRFHRPLPGPVYQLVWANELVGETAFDTVAALLGEQLSSLPLTYVTIRSGRVLVLVLSCGEEVEEAALLHALEEAHRAALSRELPLFFGVSDRFSRSGSLPEYMGQGRAALCEGEFRPGQAYVCHRDLPVHPPCLEGITGEKLWLLFRTGDTDALIQALFRRFRRQIEEGHTSVARCQEALFRIFTALLLRAAERDGMPDGFDAGLLSRLVWEVNSASCLEQCRSRFAALVRELRELHGSPSGGAGEPLAIAQARSFIRSHYREPLSLGDIASHVGLTPAYFSVMFKKETGMRLFDYINQIRVSEASALLRDSGEKIRDIAESTGFTDEKYFSKVFKKITGRSPSEYRHGAS